jgi:metallopeptidase MepB
MLSYPNHASFRIEDRLAKTPKTVLDFLGDLRTQLVSKGAKETEHLNGLKKEHLKSCGLEASYNRNYYL